MSDRPRVAVAGFVFRVARGVAITVSFRQHREFLIDYLRPQRLAVAVMSVLLLGSIALQLVTPQILSRFIDAARAGWAPDTLVPLAVMALELAGCGQLVATFGTCDSA